MGYMKSQKTDIAFYFCTTDPHKGTYWCKIKVV